MHVSYIYHTCCSAFGVPDNDNHTFTQLMSMNRDGLININIYCVCVCVCVCVCIHAFGGAKKKIRTMIFSAFGIPDNDNHTFALLMSIKAYRQIKQAQDRAEVAKEAYIAKEA